MINSLAFIILSSLILLTPNMGLANESSAFFKVSPTICVLEINKRHCDFNVQVRFRIAPYNELCLEVTKRPRYTQCYKQPGLIVEKLNIRTEYPLTIKLINPLNNNTIKQQKLTIASYEAKEYRIKRRFGWSF